MAKRLAKGSATEKAVAKIAKKLGGMAARKAGAIQFELSGGQGGDFLIDVDSRLRVKHRKGRAQDKPRIRVTGRGKDVRMVLEGKRDPRKAFLAGSVQVRGDIRYLERLLEDMKLMKPSV